MAPIRTADLPHQEESAEVAGTSLGGVLGTFHQGEADPRYNRGTVSLGLSGSAADIPQLGWKRTGKGSLGVAAEPAAPMTRTGQSG